MTLTNQATPRILVVDDEPTNLRVLRQILGDRYKLSFARSGKSAIELVEKEQPDLILLDIMMPEMTGLEVCQHLKSMTDYAHIPVIFVTALQDAVDEAQGFEIGAVDYIVKPVVPSTVLARVKTHISLVRADELHATHIDLIHRLGRAAEYKDNETGMHVQRMSHYAKVIALAYGFDDYAADELMMAAPMHDIGKIGIADRILLKPDKLTAEEFDEMKTHTLIGAEILANSRSRLIQLAHLIALTHHEKWDGSGYPNGLKGEEIPIESRIIAIADVFDALTSERPYKHAWPVEEALSYIKEQAGTHLDPDLPPLLEQNMTEILEIKTRLSD
ncbi:Response regulator receiver:Metal-dependent phosphohydrolase, HD subdomain protein [Methylophaga frappieri]|uniref:Response regulator receiver:Metal-dependent phosphohydrolase, HD subdomain protein n=1 Tax=Methylophaga frappieri (strain ATCC BAA-2434 / DSM 25690 / JAM7) TaxID=754477 RepID=I1YIM9_METFJ|nr:HD domain-containing phosphohydrolase [Methylophaga frappieri]AFJ02772.1 Response regulator receiver:Metal-dependent phosphohydrolase, HD subdomain protein [Methylophaga frappieri]